MRTLIRHATSLLTVALLTAAAGSAHATTWNVPGDMSGTCTIATPSCDTIADALAAAVANDSVQIGSGTYNESYLLVDKKLTISGAGPLNTIVDPGGAIGFLMKADGIILRPQRSSATPDWWRNP